MSLAGKVKPMNAATSVLTAPAEIPELALLRTAIAWAAARRIPVRPAAPPVVCASEQHPRWSRRDPDAAIDPIGAAILMQQPDVPELPDAAAIALRSCVSTVEGIADGLAGDRPSESWMMSTAKARYGQGYLAGIQLRTELSTWACGAHRSRQPLGVNCSGCMKALSS